MNKNISRYALLLIILTIGLITYGTLSSSYANGMLRIQGMGGARIATHARDAGIFGNPASLGQVKTHNIAGGITTEKLSWRELPTLNTEHFKGETNFDILPSSYYSNVFGTIGVSIGNNARFLNYGTITILPANFNYDLNDRQFTADASTLTNYNLTHETQRIIGLGRIFGRSMVGVRLKWITQNINTGQVLSTFNLAVQHDTDINTQDPEQLIHAITEELHAITEDLDSVNREVDIVHEDTPTREQTENGFGIDIGFQYDLKFGKQDYESIAVGLLVENLLPTDFVEPHPTKFGVGLAYEPVKGIHIAADTWYTAEQSVNFAIGTELYLSRKIAPDVGTTPLGKSLIALRLGVGSIDESLYYGAGIGITHGTFSIEYTLKNQLKDQPILEASHMLALTVHF